MSGLVVGFPILLTLILGTVVLGCGAGRLDHRAVFAHSLFAAAHMAVSVWIFLIQPVDPQTAELIMRTAGVGWLASTVVFAWSFPEGKGLAGRVWVALGVWVGLAVLGEWFLPERWSLWHTRTWFLVGTVATLVGLGKGWERARPLARVGVRWVQFLIVVRLVMVVTIYGFRRTFGGDPPEWVLFIELLIIPPVMALLLAWALLRQQLFDLRSFVSRTLGLFGVAAVSSMLLLVLVEITQRGLAAVRMGTWGEGQILAPGVVLLVVLASNPLRVGLEARLERFINRGLVRAREVTASYLGGSEGLVDEDVLLRRLSGVVRQVVPGGEVVLVLGNQPPRWLALGPGSSFREEELLPHLRALLDRGGARLPLGWWIQGMELPQAAVLESHQVQAVLWIRGPEVVEGLMILGGGPVEHERLELLHNIGQHLALQLANTSLYQQSLSANLALQESNRALSEANVQLAQMARLERELQQSRRMAALGKLAAAMAHEIRTPLTSIQLNVQILSQKMVLPPEDMEYLDITLAELDRLGKSVTEILDFARPYEPSRLETDLQHLVEDVNRGLFFLLAERGVEVEIVPTGPGPWTIPLDPERIRQVVINLLDNASHAVEQVNDRQVQVILTHTGVVGSRPSGIEVKVVDNGCGMSPDTLREAFEPFYTTRPTGTGLGLAICHKIVTAHGGELSAHNNPHQGATFRMWLPVG